MERGEGRGYLDGVQPIFDRGSRGVGWGQVGKEVGKEADGILRKESRCGENLNGWDPRFWYW